MWTFAYTFTPPGGGGAVAVELQDLLAYPDGLGRHFDPLIVGDEFHRQLEIERPEGISRMASSATEARILVCFFSFTAFTSISSQREFSPTTMPSYTSTPGPTNSSPRSCRFYSA